MWMPRFLQIMASMLNRTLTRVVRPAVRQSNRRMATSVESTAPEAALQPKKTYSAGDQKLMDAKYTEDIGYMFGEKVCPSLPPSLPSFDPWTLVRIICAFYFGFVH
mgnify:CR=1 FL=1